MPPFWLAVAVQLQWPPASFAHATVFQPSAVMLPAILLQSTWTDETDRHAGARGNAIDPVVTVLSVYVPLALAVQVPVTCSDPVTGTVLHPRLASMTSMSPDSARHDDVTVQVPTTEPPQAVPPGQFGGAPPAPVVPPVALAPPAPPVWPELPQPTFAIAAARATE